MPGKMHWDLLMLTVLTTQSATPVFPENIQSMLLQKEEDHILNQNPYSSIHSPQGFMANNSKEQKNKI